MLRSFRITILFVLLLTTSAFPAMARVVIGVTPAVTPGVGDSALLNEFEMEMAARLGETVIVRRFDTEAAVLDWLIRFRELDAALLGSDLFGTLSAGTLQHLTNLPAAVAVTHPGTTAARHETLSRAFRTLGEDARGRQLLNRLGGQVKPAVSPKSAPAQRPAAAVAPFPPTPARVALAPSSPPTAPATPARETVSPPPAKTPVAPRATPLSEPKVAMPPAAAPPAVEPARPQRSRLLLLAALVVLLAISMKIALLMRHWQRKQAVPSAPPEPPSVETFDYPPLPRQAPLSTAPFAPPPQLAASPRAPSPSPVETSSVPSAPPLDSDAPQPAVVRVSAGRMAAGKAPRPAARRSAAAGSTVELAFPPIDDELVVEQGRLGKVKVPALFKRCADLPRPVVLRVRAGDIETCVHFAAGQICHALSRNQQIDKGSRQWSKLGYLMARDGLISEVQRDQALELIERQPGLRFAAAMQQLGALDLEGLRQALIRQAKSTIYSLILFSSGEYRIEDDRGMIPAEESIALQAEELLREAAHHQGEWTAIRKVLPTWNTRLAFTPDGSDKLGQVRLSVHQQLLLTQVDGQTPLGTLCSTSTMMDYEACRFLYLMVKAGVLQTVPVA